MHKRSIQTFVLPLFFVTVVLSACSSTSKKEVQSESILEFVNTSQPCARGLIRPPGVRNCLNIAKIIEGKVKALPPIGRCPKDWQRQKTKGYCLPKYSLIACGWATFDCNKEQNDTFRASASLPECPEGTIVVTTDSPLFDENGGLYLGTRIVLACGPPSKVDPV